MVNLDESFSKEFYLLEEDECGLSDEDRGRLREEMLVIRPVCSECGAMWSLGDDGKPDFGEVGWPDDWYGLMLYCSAAKAEDEPYHLRDELSPTPHPTHPRTIGVFVKESEFRKEAASV